MPIKERAFFIRRNSQPKPEEGNDEGWDGENKSSLLSFSRVFCARQISNLCLKFILLEISLIHISESYREKKAKRSLSTQIGLSIHDASPF